MTRMKMQLVFCCNVLRKSFWLLAKAISNKFIGKTSNGKVGQDFSTWVIIESCPSQGQVGEV
jgi:hypothetical protein